MSKSADELVATLTAESSFPLPPRLVEWIHGTDEACQFVRTHEGIIRRKLRQATSVEVLNDTVAELQVGISLARSDTRLVHYERRGPRGPDLAAEGLDGDEVYVEVARIRERSFTEELEQWDARHRDFVRSQPGSLWVTLHRHGTGKGVSRRDDLREELARYVADLRQHAQAFQSWLAEQIALGERDLRPGEVATGLRPPVLAGVVEVELRKHDGAQPLPHSCPAGGIKFVPYDGREELKLSAVVTSKLRQLVGDAKNVIALVLDSTTHEADELQIAMDERRAEIRDDTASTIDPGVAAKWKRLSAVVAIPSKYRSPTGTANAVWCNPDADEPLSAPQVEALRGMHPTEPRRR